MAPARKKTRTSKTDDDDYAPPASARRLSVKAPAKREQRDRRAPKAFTPTAGTPTRRPPRKQKEPNSGDESNDAKPARPEYQRLERKVKAQAHRLRYPIAFIEAYEAQGWRNTSKDKLKPNKELETAHHKIATGQRALIDGLHELMAIRDNEPQVPPQAVFEEVHCSRCGSTDIEQNNDILLCDSAGCHRAYHQWCQTPIVLTENIPAGEAPWFCEVCLAVFECLKVINSIFGATYESVDDLFPELANAEQKAATNASSSVQSGDENGDGGNAPAAADDDDEEDEDFVFNEDEEDDDGNSSSEEQALENADDDGEEAEEVQETAEDLKYLTSGDVIDLNHRSMRSKTPAVPQAQREKRVDLVGERVAKYDRKTNAMILGVIAEFQPPTKGKHSRWRADYRDGTTELLTGQKVKGALARAAQMNDSENDDDTEGDATLIVHGKRKRNHVDYRQLNELMFAGKGEDSEEDETFEVNNEVDEDMNDDDDDGDDGEDEPDEEEGDEGEQDHDQDVEEEADDNSDQSSPTAVTGARDETSQPEKPSCQEHPHVNYLSMQEGLLNPC